MNLPRTWILAVMVMSLTGCSGSDKSIADEDTATHTDSGTQTEAHFDADSVTETGDDTGAGTAANTDSATGSNKDSATGTNTDSATGTNTDSATGTNTDSATGTNTVVDSVGTDSAPAEVRLPPANALWDYQIGGGYPPADGVEVVSRDREDAPAEGRYNICYVNGFQIQPHEEKWWETNYPELILRDSNGDPVVDAGWDEMLLDVRTETNRSALAVIVGKWITGCAEDGFNAVEIDNLDSYSRSDGLIAQTDNIAFMGMLSDIAHENGLAAAQKNAAAFLNHTREMKTDFAVVEECNRWKECGDFKNAYGELLFIVEYRTQDFEAGCSAFPEVSIVLRDMNVSPPTSSNYVYDGC